MGEFVRRAEEAFKRYRYSYDCPQYFFGFGSQYPTELNFLWLANHTW